MKLATRQDVAHARLARQRLVGPPGKTAEDVVGHLCAVQAQDYAGAKWAIARRTKAPRASGSATS